MSFKKSHRNTEKLKLFVNIVIIAIVIISYFYFSLKKNLKIQKATILTNYWILKCIFVAEISIAF